MNCDCDCDCGCGKPRVGKSAYASPACRTRAWKGRVAYGPQKPLEGRSNGNPPKRQRQSGAQYARGRADRELADFLLMTYPLSPRLTDAEALDLAEAILRPALSDRQRAMLDNRKARNA